MVHASTTTSVGRKTCVDRAIQVSGSTLREGRGQPLVHAVAAASAGPATSQLPGHGCDVRRWHRRSKSETSSGSNSAEPSEAEAATVPGRAGQSGSRAAAGAGPAAGDPQLLWPATPGHGQGSLGRPAPITRAHGVRPRARRRATMSR
jgi:hypothetical protein